MTNSEEHVALRALDASLGHLPPPRRLLGRGHQARTPSAQPAGYRQHCQPSQDDPARADESLETTVGPEIGSPIGTHLTSTVVIGSLSERAVSPRDTRIASRASDVSAANAFSAAAEVAEVSEANVTNTQTRGNGAGSASGEGLTIRPQTLHLTPQYRRVRDAILRPQLRLTESRYFWERWKPLLGPDATVLIMEVRDRCNRALASLGSVPAPPSLDEAAGRLPGGGLAGELGSGCTVSANDLAAACGFSRVTLWRLLQREDVRRFVQVEHNYIYDRRLGKKRRTVSTYRVLMEDPLVESDEPRLRQLLAAHGLPTDDGQVAAAPFAGTARHPALPGNDGSTNLPLPTVQSVTKVVDNPPPTLHSETNRGGFNPKPQNVLETILKKRLGGETSPLDQEYAHIQTPAAAATGTAGLSWEVDIWRRYPELAHHVEEAEALLKDAHSRGFYLNTLRALYPHHLDVWHRALALAREQQNIKRSRAALFTRLLRTFAAQAGVTL